MTSFIQKTISSPITLPELLQKNRLNLGLSLLEAARITGVPEKYLQALEDGNYSSLPGEIYVRAFLKKYSDLLKLQAKAIVKMYQEERGTQLTLPVVLPPKPLTKKIFSFSPRFFTTASIALGIVACVGYIGWQLLATYRPPELTITYPQNNLTTNNSQLTVSGKAESEIVLLINRERILVAPDGSFAQNMDLQEGVNQIIIEARKKHGQPKIVNLSIFRQQAEAVKPTSPSALKGEPITINSPHS